MHETSYTLELESGETISAELYRPDNVKAAFVFAHGAGASMHHPFMKELSQELYELEIATLRYNFLYIEQKKKRPDFPKIAHQAVAASIQKAGTLFPDIPISAGGKSFGGRMTSQYLALHPTHEIKGIVFVGFPLHPAGQPSTARADHLNNIQIPMLFLQGTRDALAEWNLINDVCSQLPTATLSSLEGADHSFKSGKKNLLPELAKLIYDWYTKIA